MNVRNIISIEPERAVIILVLSKDIVFVMQLVELQTAENFSANPHAAATGSGGKLELFYFFWRRNSLLKPDAFFCFV